MHGYMNVKLLIWGYITNPCVYST